MMKLFLRLRLASSVLSVVVVLVSLSSNLVVATDQTQQAMIHWLRANGGIFSDKVEFRHLDPNDETSPNGLFAKEALKEKEPIMLIPHKCLLVSPEEAPGGPFCGMARKLVDEKRQGDKSFFKDYVNYIFDGNKKKKLPDRWSDDAMEIMNEIVGDELPSPFHQRSFAEHCGGSNEFLEDAYELVVSRSWTEVMIPVYDMVNHRNGRWRNVEATSAHTGEDITVFAFRDVEAGEQLCISYNECLDTDCEDLFFYGTVEVLGDYGFVEEYPQRWIWDSFYSHQENPSPLVVELEGFVAPDPYDPENQPMQMHVTWHTDARPDLQMINVMSGHLKALKNLEDFVQQSTQALISEHERYTIRQFHKSLMLALQYTIWSFYDEAIDDLASDEEGDDDGRHYDSLAKRPVIGNPDGYFLNVCHPNHEQIGPDYTTVFMEQSQYQRIEYRYGEEEDDSCLWLSGWGQTCSSFRQYHEALVHYPASFLKEVKRVVYIGGGDNMILHEILKYPAIELVVGLEMDQAVVRYSFMNMGTLPYFDDPRVQWWFGDATKSLLMLPKDYFGSFDLVLVDLQTFVADSLFVTDKLSIMDTMKLLLKPNGIISKNEDFPNRKITDFAKYTVDMEYCDLPQICRQSITIGSNGVNFLTARHYKHDIHTIYINETLESEGRFKNWYDFREKQAGNTSAAITINADKQDDSASSLSKCNKGVLVVIEAEELSKTLISKKEFVVALTMALRSNGVEVLHVDDWALNENHFDIVLIFLEGYLILRKRLAVDNYVAIDMVLWDGIDKINVLKKSVIESIGGDEQKSSSYRLVTGGINGICDGPFLEHYYFSENEICENPDAADAEDSKPIDPLLAWSEFANLIHDEKTSIVVLCGLKDSNCTSWDILKGLSINAFVLYACEGASEGSDERLLFKCEVEMAKTLRKSLSNKINGIWLDTTASKATAKVLLRLLTGQVGRTDIFDTDNYTVLAQLVTGEEWREIFFERFRTEVSPFAPAREARLSFADNSTFSLFSAGDDFFYRSLLKFVEGFEKKLQLKPTLHTVMSGHPIYVPNFSPKFFNNQAYNNSRASAQWNSQHPMGFQTIFQMELNAPKTPLKVGEEVLFQYYDHVWSGRWIEATIVRKNEDLTYDIEPGRLEIRQRISRDSLRRLDFDVTATPIPTIEIGARVIYKKSAEWFQGFVVSRSEDGKEYEIREYDADGVIMALSAEDLIPQLEKTHAEELPMLSLVRLKKTLKGSLAKVVGAELVLKGHEIGDGCVITAFWKGGDAILVWDGDNHIDINFFLDDEDNAAADTFHSAFIKKIPFLDSTTRDEQPRGCGNVVNFGSEINRDEDPIWWPHEME